MKFTKTHSGYTVETTAKSGRTLRIRIRKQESLNPSARGGAYRTEWVAKFGTNKATGDTRQEAVERLLQQLAKEGLVLTINA